MHSSNKKKINKLFVVPIIGTAMAVILTLGFYNFYLPRHTNKTLVYHSLDLVTPTLMAIPTPTIKIPESMKFPIIMYHYVEVVRDSGDTTRIKLDINPSAFDRQLKSLKDNGYTTYFVKDIPEIFMSGKVPESKSIILTFDDGYQDVYDNAFPLLKKYQMKGTLYIVTNFIGRKGYMTKLEISEMLQSGLIEVGAHTVNHADLKRIPLDKAKKEIVDSKKILEDMFSIQVKTFAYPGGAYNDNVVNMVKEASFEAAVSTKPGVTLQYDNLFVLPRIRPGFLSFSSIMHFFDKLHF